MVSLLNKEENKIKEPKDKKKEEEEEEASNLGLGGK
jgi:hypothetical protein